MSKIDHKTIEKMAELWAKGYRIEDIGLRFGIRPNTVKNYLTANRDLFPSRKKMRSPEILAKASRLWQEGLVAREIAERLGITKNAVVAMARDNRHIFPSRKRAATMKVQGENLKSVSLLQGEKPTPENTVIEDPPNFPDPPEGAKYKAWFDLEVDECQWSLENFWAEESNKFPCCGKKTAGGHGLGRRFCEYHMKAAIKEEEE